MWSLKGAPPSTGGQGSALGAAGNQTSLRTSPQRAEQTPTAEQTRGESQVLSEQVSEQPTTEGEPLGTGKSRYRSQLYVVPTSPSLAHMTHHRATQGTSAQMWLTLNKAAELA